MLRIGNSLFKINQTVKNYRNNLEYPAQIITSTFSRGFRGSVNSFVQ